MSTGAFAIPLISTDGSGVSTSEADPVASVPRYFVAGPENRLLCVLESAIETQPPQFNPLTLCGPTGVGKSHLLHGLVERHRTIFAGARRAVMTGADFARGYARAVEVDAIADWREKQRQVDLLVIDDLHELAHKPQAQLELVQTLDALIDQERQILLSSRQAVPDWTWMLRGLRSRIGGGLVIPVSPPGREARQRIYEELATAYGLTVASDGELSDTPAVLTYPQIRSVVLRRSQQLADSGSNSGSDPEPRRLTRRERTHVIAKAVARQSQIPLADLRGPSRRHSTVRARGTAIYLCRTLLQISFDEIGDYFGGRDHTTVLHSWHTTCQRLDSDPAFRHDVTRLTTSLQALDVADGIESRPVETARQFRNSPGVEQPVD